MYAGNAAAAGPGAAEANGSASAPLFGAYRPIAEVRDGWELRGNEFGAGLRLISPPPPPAPPRLLVLDPSAARLAG